jgi:hypothetical protein
MMWKPPIRCDEPGICAELKYALSLGAGVVYLALGDLTEA